MAVTLVPDLRYRLPLGECRLPAPIFSRYSVQKDAWYCFHGTESKDASSVEWDIYYKCQETASSFNTEQLILHAPVTIWWQKERPLPDASPIHVQGIEKVWKTGPETNHYCYHVHMSCQVELCAQHQDERPFYHQQSRELSYLQDYDLVLQYLKHVPVRQGMRYRFSLRHLQYTLLVLSVQSEALQDSIGLIVPETTVTILPVMTTDHPIKSIVDPPEYVKTIVKTILAREDLEEDPIYCIQGGDHDLVLDAVTRVSGDDSPNSVITFPPYLLIPMDAAMDLYLGSSTSKILENLDSILRTDISPTHEMLQVYQEITASSNRTLILCFPYMEMYHKFQGSDLGIAKLMISWYRGLYKKLRVKLVFMVDSSHGNSFIDLFYPFSTRSRLFKLATDSNLLSDFEQNKVLDNMGPFSAAFLRHLPLSVIRAASKRLSHPQFHLMLCRLKQADKMIGNNDDQVLISSSIQKVFQQCLGLLSVGNETIGRSIEKRLEWLTREDSSWQNIGGYSDIKELLTQAIYWPLCYPDTFSRLGLHPPRGVLLYGPPGCSKTNLARHVAQQWPEIHFLSVRASELYSCYVGESEKYVRELFQHARSKVPCVLFLDELDALVGKRDIGGRASGTTDIVQERILSALLNEMDGIETLQDGVLVMAATNRLDRIDDALLRPGRFDKLIHVPLPDLVSRQEILKIHLRAMPFSGDDTELQSLIETIATKTDGLSGAELARICQEAGLMALREDLSMVSSHHFLSSLDICANTSE